MHEEHGQQQSLTYPIGGPGLLQPAAHTPHLEARQASRLREAVAGSGRLKQACTHLPRTGGRHEGRMRGHPAAAEAGMGGIWQIKGGMGKTRGGTGPKLKHPSSEKTNMVLLRVGLKLEYINMLL